jgi:hypothetical protein
VSQVSATSNAGSTLALLVPNATVFASSFCVMVIELVAGRMIAGDLGSSIYSWRTIMRLRLLAMVGRLPPFRGLQGYAAQLSLIALRAAGCPDLFRDGDGLRESSLPALLVSASDREGAPLRVDAWHERTK